jgi:hypothetical protein
LLLCDDLGDETAEREAQQVDFAKTQGAYECDGVPSHLLDRFGCRTAGSADSAIVEYNHVVLRCQAVHDPRIPVFQYRRYLSVRHRDNRPTSCLFSSLGTEAARGSADLRHRMTEAVRSRINHLSVEAEGDRPKEKRRAAIAAWSAMVGAMVLARLVDDETLSKEILSATRASLPLV